MPLIIDLPDDQVAALKAKAASAGLSLEGWFLKLAETGIDASDPSAPSIVHLQKSNPQEWARQFRAWADGHDTNVPVLSDSAMSRESIYPDLA
ncbi:MAG: hypothetical protein ABSB86_13265 [Bryobacteraceae bacterium]|jgi:hypothetical protein